MRTAVTTDAVEAGARVSVCAFLSKIAVDSWVFWIAYAVSEVITATLIPLIRTRYGLLTALHWQWTGILLLCYVLAAPCFGLVAWALLRMAERFTGKDRSVERHVRNRSLTAAALFRKASSERDVRIGGLALTLFFGVLFPYRFPHSLSLGFFLGTVGLMAWVHAAAALSETWAERLQGFTSPWLLAVAFIAPSAVVAETASESSPLVKAAVSLIVLLLSAGVALAARKRKAFTRQRRSLARQLAGVCCALSIVLWAGFLVTLSRTTSVKQAATNVTGAAQGPNVILIVWDTVRGDHTSLLGYERDTTPHLRRLAAEATTYTTAFSTADLTLTTHASMFTGLYARQHGAVCSSPQHIEGAPLAESFRTMPEILANAGYATIGVAANSSYLVPQWGLAQGFQGYGVRAEIPVEPLAPAILLRSFLRPVLRPFLATQDLDSRFARAADVNGDAFAMLDRSRPKMGSFLLFLNYMDAHAPYSPPAPYDRRYEPQMSPVDFRSYTQAMKAVNRERAPIRLNDRRKLIAQYDGGIAYMDEQLGNLLDGLKRRGLYDDSLIIVTADHGEEFGDHDVMEHGLSIYQGSIHIPLVIKYPHSHEGHVIQTAVSQIDLLPTVLGVAGIPAPNFVAGIDLRNAERSAPRILISASYPCFADYSPRFDRTDRALISGGMKLMESSQGARELYDLTADPQEQSNLYAKDNPVARQMAVLMSTWMKQHPRWAEPMSKVDTEAIRRLKSLGYAQ
jgi:arylsulfatase A-like enzyme